VDIKDRLISFSKNVEDPKDLAQLSNALNAVSKTLDDFLERSRGGSDEDVVSPDEYLKTLLFLRSEGVISFSEESLNELRRRLLETVSEE
jgi:hypothetical protein